ncbi:MAG: hypothetical protein L0Y80_02985 [Ignavibacteriae bacterium]|nr:hypothetical protein [Ignavibacteriota bacterium]
MNTFLRHFCFFIAPFVFGSTLVAQVTPLISKVNTPQANENRALAVGVEFSQSTGVASVVLHYRAFGETDFQQMDMLIAGRTATATIPAETVLPPYIEYYIEAQMNDGKVETYPLQNPMAVPQRIPVKARNPKDDEIRFLSPEAGETVDIDELVVAISFFYSGEAVKPEATKIFLDNVDVSSSAVYSDDVLLYSPRSAGQELLLGAHRLRVEVYDTAGQLYHTRETGFNVSTAAAIAEEQTRLRAFGDGQLEIRNENLNSIGTSTSYIRGDLRLNGTYGILNFGGNTHIDNQEDPTRQPQNRFLGYASTSFLSVLYGDAYPRFPSNIVSGKRVRGLTANLMLGFFNVDFTMGETNRLVEGTALYDTTFADSSSAASRPTNTKLVNGLTYTVFNSGTFTRDFFALRPSFGSGESYQLGFTYMRAKDKLGSIQYGTQPQDNVVLGTDFMFAFDDQRVRLDAQASLSLKNTDISPEAGTIEDIKNTDPETYDDIVNNPAYDIISSMITINKNLFPTNPVAEGLPGVTYEASLSLNYFNNFLQGALFHRGAAYSSFGNEFLQTDVAGFTISDRIRMFSNKVFFSISYDKRNDNTANTKDGTTNFDYINTSLTVVPGANIPSFTFGYGSNSQLSDYTTSRLDFATSTTLTGADSTELGNSLANAVDNKTSQIYVAANYDFEAGVRQSLIVNVNVVNKEDKTFFKRDQTNVNIQATVTSQINPMLQTMFSYLLSQNENQSQFLGSDGRDVGTPILTNLDYSAISAGAILRMMDERLLLQASLSPTFGSVNRTIARVGADYTVAPQHTLLFLFDYVQNGGFKDDTIGSLIYRFAF